MTGILDDSLSEKFTYSKKKKKLTHPCDKKFSLYICEFDADNIKRHDSAQLAALLKSGVTIAKIEMEDFDKVGELIDEAEANLGSSIHDDKFLFKHAIAVRENYTLLSVDKCHNAKRNKTCSKVFGHNLLCY